MQFTHDIVRMMGVHVLAVYILLQCAEQEGQVPTSHQWVLDHMPDKTSPNTVTAALRWLTSPERQIATRVVGGWRLNQENAFQLPLTYSLPEGQNRAERDFGDSIVIVNSPINTESINNNNKGQNRAERDSHSGGGFGRPKEELGALNAAMAAYRIVGKKKNELLACDWVDADYVRASVEFAQAEGRGEYAVGMAITRMLDHVTQPTRKENGHIENCHCDQCSAGEWSKYFDKYICGDCNQSPCICEYDLTGVQCVWTTDTGEKISSSGRIRHIACTNPCKKGSSHWCEEHYQQGVALYGTGEIADEESEAE